MAVALGVRWENAWEPRRKTRWKTIAVDEGEPLGTFYRAQEGGEAVLGM
jgi:hypothetical protein